MIAGRWSKTAGAEEGGTGPGRGRRWQLLQVRSGCPGTAFTLGTTAARPEVPRGAIGRSWPCLPSGGAVLICGSGRRLRPLHAGGLFYLHHWVGTRGWLAVHHSRFPTTASRTVFLSVRKQMMSDAGDEDT